MALRSKVRAMPRNQPTDPVIPSAATGELAAWQSVALLPVARANHCSTPIGGWLLGFRAQAQYALGKHFAFVLGGYRGDTGDPVTADLFVAPEPTSFAGAVVGDHRMFVVAC